jgi:integrase
MCRRRSFEEEEIKILTADQITRVTDILVGHPLYEIAVVNLATGMRRGEILALRGSDVDLDGVAVRIERSLEETRKGLPFKAPKTKHRKRSISLPRMVSRFCGAPRTLLETRMALGLGKPDGYTLLFGVERRTPAA